MKQIIYIFEVLILAVLFGCSERSTAPLESKMDIAANPIGIDTTYDGLVCESKILEDMGSYCLAGGDMILDKRDPEVRKMIKYLNGEEDTTRLLQKQSAFFKRGGKWPNNTVTYILKSDFSPSQVSYINSAMAAISKASGVIFKRYVGGSYFWEDYYIILKDNGITGNGQSTVGYGNINRCELKDGFGKKTAIHEFMHGLGYQHEHQRSDRPITINWDNISPGPWHDRNPPEFEIIDDFTWWGYRKNYRKYSYDYQSIMHYGEHAFAKSDGNGKYLPTIDAGEFTPYIGRWYLSSRDIDGLRWQYGNAPRINITSYLSFQSQLYSPFTKYEVGGTGHLEFLSGDINNDGKTDIFHIYNDFGRVSIATYSSNNVYYSPSSASYSLGGVSAIKFLAGDFTGDGKTDIAHLWPNGNWISIELYKSNGFNFVNESGGYTLGGNKYLDLLMGDVNGDGKKDIVHLWNNGGWVSIENYISNGHSFDRVASSKRYGGAGHVKFFLEDITGDGKADVIQLWNNRGRLGVEVYVSTGTSYSRYGGSNNIGGIAAEKFAMLDVNGDGTKELIHIYNNGGRVSVATYGWSGSQIVLWSSGYTLGGIGAIDFVFGDMNGDGRDDILHLWDNCGFMGMEYYWSNGTAFDRGDGNPLAKGVISAHHRFFGNIDGDNEKDLITIW